MMRWRGPRLWGSRATATLCSQQRSSWRPGGSSCLPQAGSATLQASGLSQQKQLLQQPQQLSPCLSCRVLQQAWGWSTCRWPHAEDILLLSKQHRVQHSCCNTLWLGGNPHMQQPGCSAVQGDVTAQHSCQHQTPMQCRLWTPLIPPADACKTAKRQTSLTTKSFGVTCPHSWISITLSSGQPQVHNRQHQTEPRCPALTA